VSTGIHPLADRLVAPPPDDCRRRLRWAGTASNRVQRDVRRRYQSYGTSRWPDPAQRPATLEWPWPVAGNSTR